MAKQFFIEGRAANGLTYSDYFNNAVKQADSADISKMGDDEKHMLEYTRLNIKRSERVDKTYAVSPELQAKLMAITKPQIWMVITEIWCGDSAQNLPYIVKMAEVNPLINLRIVLRDQNADIMDEYLTNGTKSIPILVAFDETGNELFKWGPRPFEAAELVRNAKAAGKTKDQFIEELHLWYGRNKGAALESEFIKFLA